MRILGKKSSIASSAQIADSIDLIMGDCSIIGENVNVVGRGMLRIGDYVKIHRFSFIICYGGVTLGHNVWVGEKAIIDGTGELTIGNNVGIGIGSQVYTHIAFGDAFSGCRLRSSKRIKINNEAWLVGQCIVQASSIASRVVVMPGSNVTKDIKVSNSIWAGSPAIDLTVEFGGKPWNDVTIEQKMKHFDALRRTYAQRTNMNISDIEHKFRIVDSTPDASEREQGVSYFNVVDRSYTKTQSDEEQRFMTWLLTSNKAKFTPTP